jgi:Rieske Fe-S protein
VTWTRRIFVRDALKGWIGLVLAPSMYSALRLLQNSGSDVTVGPKDIGATNSLQPGKNKTVYLGKKKVIVARSRDGSLHAVSAICTHLGCSIRMDSEVGKEGFACNCHASRFSFDGENLGGPATLPLEKFAVTAKDGRMVLTEIEEAR